MTERNDFKLSLDGNSEHAVRIASGETLTIGSDASSRFQIVHRSVAPTHCLLENKNGLLKLIPVDGAAVAVETRFLRGPANLVGGERIRVGAITLDLKKLGIDAPHATDRKARRKRRRFPLLGAVASTGVHVVVVALLFLIPFLQKSESTPEAVLATMLEEPSPVPTPELPVEKLTSESPPEPDFESPLVDDDPVEESEPLIEQVYGLGGMPGAASKALVGNGRHSGLSLTERIDGLRDFGETLGGWGKSGLDLVFVIDTTVSMESALDRVKSSMGKLIRFLSVIAPEMRVGIVAYTDNDEPQPVRTLALTDERYRLLNFIEDLSAEGGGDFEEALTPGLVEAVRGLSWRREARRIIILVGDAPPHQETLPMLYGTVKEHVESNRRKRGPGALSTLLVLSEDRVAKRRRPEVAALFHDLAQRGGGVAIELEGRDLSARELSRLVFGDTQDGWKLIERPLRSTRGDLVKRRVDRRDRAWLLSKMRRPSPHPEVVEGIIRLADGQIVRRLIKLLRTPERIPLEGRFAALYALKKILKVRSSFDPNLPVESQKEAIHELLRASIRRGYSSARELSHPDSPIPKAGD